jgi:hypothetical protein
MNVELITTGEEALSAWIRLIPQSLLTGSGKTHKNTLILPYYAYLHKTEILGPKKVQN